jgi:hypothetical protein
LVWAVAEEDALQPVAAQLPRMLLPQAGVLTPRPKVDAQEPPLAADVPVEEAEGRP